MNNVMVVDVVDERSRLVRKTLEKEHKTMSLKEYIDLQSGKVANVILSVGSKLDHNTVDKIAPHSKIFYFFMDSQTAEMLRAKDCELINFMNNEHFVRQNSYLTAEGSIGYIIASTDKCLRDMRFAVIGWGNLAKAMVQLLDKFGCQIIVLTRSKEDKKQTVVTGYDHMPYDECDYRQFDCIVNTVPYRLFEANPAVNKDVFVLELASKVFPFDYDDFKYKGIRHMIASSVPSKTAPMSAAQLLCDVALSLST